MASVRSREERCGFTLLEALVVMVVIALLCALILPAIQMARESSRRMTCASHLRDWALGVNYYADVHHGYLPRRGQGVGVTTRFDRPQDWFNAVAPFIEQTPYNEIVVAAGTAKPIRPQRIWMCPSEPTENRVPFFSYGMNMWLSTWVAARPDHRGKVGATSTMVLFSESPGTHCSILPSTRNYSVVARHTGSVNVAFLDGHVAAFEGDYVGCHQVMPEPERPGLRWKVPNSIWEGACAPLIL